MRLVFNFYCENIGVFEMLVFKCLCGDDSDKDGGNSFRSFG